MPSPTYHAFFDTNTLPVDDVQDAQNKWKQAAMGHWAAHDAAGYKSSFVEWSGTAAP
jgi:hypothetical protein